MSNDARRHRRWLAGVLAGALALSVSPILGFTGVAGAAIDPTGDGNVCEDAPETEPFTDIADDDIANEHIECMTNTDPVRITEGVTATTYEPNSPVTRRQMALFLWRVGVVAEAHEINDEVTELPAGDGVVEFSDIESDDIAFDEIDSISDANVALGFPDGTFRPNEPVTRRQMAKFLVRLQEFLAGEDITPDNPPDAFDDDNGDSGEDELNVLAAEGVFEGDGQGNVNPGANISRRQMALVITRKLEWFFENGVIGRLFPEDDTNQAFTVTPAEESTNPVSVSTTSNEGRHEYTVTGLDDTETYRLELFPSENVIVDENNMVTFVDTTPNDGHADEGTVDPDADIETVNGAGVAPSDEVNVTSDGGTLTFAIDSESPESVVPVIWVDADDDGMLDLDADDGPTELFAIGGIKNWFEEAPAGAPAGFDADITNVDKQNNFFDAGGLRYFYDPANDLFFISDTHTTDPADCVAVSAAEFEAELSTFDELEVESGVTQYSPSTATPAGNSSFCIENHNPDLTTGVTATPVNDTSVVVAINDDDVQQDSFNIYRALGDQTANDCSNVDFNVSRTGFTLVANVPEDGDNTAPEESFTDTGLAADTTYCYVVTAVNDGDEGPGVEDDATTLPAGQQAAPTIENAVLTTDNVVIGAADSGDAWTLTFSEAMADGGVGTEDGTFTLTDGDGDVIIVDCGLAAAPGDGFTSATCTYDATDTILTIDLVEDAEDRTVAGNGVVTYPVTITDTDGVTDAGHGLEVDLANSDDVVIGEGGTTGD